MIYLLKNTSNIIAVTSSDVASLEDFFFLFRFFNVETKEETFLQIESDNAGNPRWDRFTIVMPDDVDLASGNYQYFVYQSEVDGSEEWESMKELETGKLNVPQPDTNDKTFNENASTDKVFQFS